MFLSMPARAHLVGFKTRIRVETLGPDTFLKRRCILCDRKVRIATWQLHARYPAAAKLMDIDRFWRCKACGVAGKLEWAVWQAFSPVELVRVETPVQRLRRERREAVVATGRALAAFGGRPARAGADEASVDRALDLLHLAGGRLAMPELARIVGVPERSLRRRVEEAVGLSFKALASVLRFQRTLRLLAGPEGRTLTLAQAALEAGYADQAHMTREFRRHGGFTPARQPPVALGSLPLGGLAETFKIEAASPA
jgi:AraC-like DNA-binding protein